jgi:hypothetical protein
MAKHRRLTPEEAIMLADPKEVNMWRSIVTHKPLLSRSQWERLPRGRRIKDQLLFRQPPKGFGDEDF